MNYNIGDTVAHKTKMCTEQILSFCKVKVNGVWVEGVIYSGIDSHTNEPMTFVRTKEDFESNFEIYKG